MKNYESPIEIFKAPIESVVKQRNEQEKKYILQCVEKIGVKVNKEELIKALQYDRHQYEKGYKDGYDDGCSSGGWISVDERMPEESGYVLTSSPLGFTLCQYSKKHKLFNASDNDSYEHSLKYALKWITHWMPLPDAPKGCETDDR